MARLLAQARVLPGAVTTEDGQRAPSLQNDPLRKAKLEAELSIFKRLHIADQKVHNIEKVLTNFEEQLEKLPPAHAARTLVGQVCDTLRKAIAAAEKGQG